MVDNLGIVPRVIEVFEMITDVNLEISLLLNMQVFFKMTCKDAAQLIRRPAFMKKFKASLDLKTLPASHVATAMTLMQNITRIGTVAWKVLVIKIVDFMRNFTNTVGTIFIIIYLLFI
jgi:hypothetical protein